MIWACPLSNEEKRISAENSQKAHKTINPMVCPVQSVYRYNILIFHNLSNFFRKSKRSLKDYEKYPKKHKKLTIPEHYLIFKIQPPKTINLVIKLEVELEDSKP